MSDEALKILESYSWPGNVRELRNVIESMVVLNTTGRITLEDLPSHVLRGGEPEERAESGPGAGPARTAPPRRSLATTNAAESLISRTRHVKRNVKRWRSVRMVRRWAGTMLMEVEKKFRRIRGHKSMSLLVGSLRSGTAVAQKAVVA